jgi:DNA repair protein RAD50
LSKKELDRQVPQLLGVSKAILENVVFCHQEESSWPLQEGAVLKKKFDDIFDSTRYSKALDVFAKLKKEYTLKTKDLKASVMEFKSHNHAAQGFQREIAKYNEQLEELEESLASDREALKENEEEQQRIKLIQDQVEVLESKIDQKNSDIALDRSVISKHRSMLQKDMTDKHSLKELQDMLRSFDTEFEGRRDQKHELEAKMTKLLRETDNIREQRSKLQSQVGRLQAAKESHDKNLRERYQKMVEIGTEYGLGDLVSQISQNSQGSNNSIARSQDTSFASLGYASLGNASTLLGSPPMGSRGVSQQQQQYQQPILNISQEDMDEYSRAIQRKQAELQEQLLDKKAQRKQQEDMFNNEIMELKGKLKALESDKDRIQKEVTRTIQEISECRNKASKGKSGVLGLHRSIFFRRLFG